MATRILQPTLIDLTAAQARAKFGKLRLRPSQAVQATAAGGTFVALQLRWGTCLVPDTLKVVLRRGDPVDADVTARLTIDEQAMMATGTLDTGGVGTVVVEASGEFLAQLAPMRNILLQASSAAYLPA